MATSLRAFQAEIDSISQKANIQHLQDLRSAQAASEHAKHRSAGAAAAAAEAATLKKAKEQKEKEKEQRLSDAKDDGNDGKEGAKEEEETGPTLEDILHTPLDPSLSIEDDPLRPALAHSLLINHGELLLSLGAHPAPEFLYATTPTSMDEMAKDGFRMPTVGKEIKDLEELERLKKRLGDAVHGINAELSEVHLNPSTSSPPTSTSTSTSDPDSTPPTSTSTTQPPPSIQTHQGPYSTYMIRLPPTSIQSILETRIAVVGNVDSGKSTILGVLTRGHLDDGRGKARVALFRHKHEIETGRTSSVGMEILGFDVDSKEVIPKGHQAQVNAALGTGAQGGDLSSASKREKANWDEICSKAAKVVSFIDLAGHERYLKTTLFGLTGCSPDYVLLVVGGNAGLIGMSKEHLGVALALQVPVMVCVTKIDMTPAHVLEQTIKQLIKVLKSPGCRRVPVFVETAEQAVQCGKYLSSSTHRICPIFLVSNVTGANLPTLRTMLNVLPSCQAGGKYQRDQPLEFTISDVFSVPFSGSVASGVITSGYVKAGDAVLLGPDSLGQFIPTVIKSIQRKRAPVEEAEAGQSVSFALKKIRRSQLRKGQVIVAKTDPPPKAVRRFEGQVLILYHNTTIQPRYQAVCHVNSVRQTVKIVSLDHPKGILRTGDRARVIFEFVQGPEYIREGAKMLFREGKTRGLGVVTKILP